MSPAERAQNVAQTVAVFSLALDIACHRLTQACSLPGEVHAGAGELRQALVDEAAVSLSHMSAAMDMIAEVAGDGANGTGGGPVTEEG